MRLILHNYRRCPFCIRVRIVLALKNIPYEIVEEPLRVWTNWMYKNVSDKRVPVLRVIQEDGREEVMQESNDINLFLDGQFGKPTLTPKEGSDGFYDMKMWWAWCRDELKPQIDIYKYGRDLKFDKEKNIEDTITLKETLGSLETALQKSRYLIGEKLTLADIAIIPFIRQIMRTRGGEFDFSNFPRTKEWTENVVESDWFLVDVMKKVPVERISKEDLEKRQS